MPDELYETERAERCMAIGRMLQAQPTPAVLSAFFDALPDMRAVATGAAGASGSAGSANSKPSRPADVAKAADLGTPRVSAAAEPTTSSADSAAGAAVPNVLDADDIAAIEQDYLRLFVGLGTPLAPPWESAWASDARLLFQRQTLDVRYWYRSAGLQVAALHRQPDDHIGLELEFVGRLRERHESETAAAFACEHPLTWADRWAAAVNEHARHPFYPALAKEVLLLLR
jgi:TorA maturation chaperone TorD